MAYTYPERTIIGNREIIEVQKYQIIWCRPGQDIAFCTSLVKWEEWLLNNDLIKEGDISALTDKKYIKATCGECKKELHYSKLIPEDQKGLPLCLSCGQNLTRYEKAAKDRRNR